MSSTREEYVALVEELRERSPGKVKDESKRSKMEHAHIALVKALEGRLELIDNEIAVSNLPDSAGHCVTVISMHLRHFFAAEKRTRRRD